jgi:hypothetical protein
MNMYCMFLIMVSIGVVYSVDLNGTDSKFCKKECNRTCTVCYDLCTGDDPSICQEKCDNVWQLCNDICDFIPL